MAGTSTVYNRGRGPAPSWTGHSELIGSFATTDGTDTAGDLIGTTQVCVIRPNSGLATDGIVLDSDKYVNATLYGYNATDKALTIKIYTTPKYPTLAARDAAAAAFPIETGYLTHQWGQEGNDITLAAGVALKPQKFFCTGGLIAVTATSAGGNVSAAAITLYLNGEMG